jgi:hypothetical protein
MLRRLLVTPTRLQRVAAAVLALAGVSALFYLGAQPGSGDFIPQGTDKVVHFLAFCGPGRGFVGGRYRPASDRDRVVHHGRGIGR